MLTGPWLLFALFVTIGLIVWLSSRAKVHPFMALLLATMGLGLAVGLPGPDILKAVQDGFGSLMGYIGLIVVLGSIIGVILERSGGALRIAMALLSVFGKGRPALAMSLIGGVVGIPVFCDSGFIILSRLNQVLAERTGKPPASLALGLAAGLYTTHTLVPPTPGPIAAAGNLGATDYLGTIILLGLAFAIPTALVAWGFARWQGGRLQPSLPELPPAADLPALPPLSLALGPILLPVLLIALASLSRLLDWEGNGAAVLAFVGSPLIALLLGTLLAGALLPRWDEAHLSGWIGDGIRQAGPILVLTGAGGAFGSLLKATPLADYVAGWAGEGQLAG
ncbi:MAG: GntP family permease, partial [Bacteroidetes bacterium]